MIGITLSADQIRSAPPEVRRWIEHEVIAALGVAAAAPVMQFRLMDILHHTRLQNIGQVIECLDAINRALADVRRDSAARFCGFDHEGHCLIAPQTQASVAAVWQDMTARAMATAG